MSDTQATVMLALEHVSHSYQARGGAYESGVHTVLDDVSLQVYEGETLGIIGRNGVGKTTMLRLMAGILAPTRGEVWRHPGKTAALLSLGLGFKPELSGRDNARLSAILQGCSTAQAEGYLDEIQAFSELGASFDEPVKTYSSGMRSRLGFSAALVTHVDILLIDEVLSVGDAAFRGKAEAAMKQRISGEQTVVFVSHMDNQISEICDRAVWIDQGRIEAQGETRRVLDKYKSALGKPKRIKRE